MIDKLEGIKDRFREVGELLSQPDAMLDMKRFSQLSKEYKDLEKMMVVYDQYTQTLADIAGAKQILETEKDEDFRDMAKAEINTLEPEKDRLEEVLRDMLIPKDPMDSKNVILEIRGGTGGDEVLAGYSRYVGYN
jgi:peptide chain release factor 1